MFNKEAKKHKNKFFFKNIYIKKKNFPQKPNKGGTPANEVTDKKIDKVNKFVLPINLKSVNDLKLFKSNKNKIKNINDNKKI